MCIIVAKPAGAKMPATDTLEICDWTNPDGSGFMIADGETVRIRKGFMDFDEFADALNAETDGIDTTAAAIVMHFRIATHGDVIPGCCHPFPLTDDEEALLSTSVDAPIGVAHNGIIREMVTGKTRSDTMDFIARIMTPLAKIAPDFIYDENAAELLENACKSKLAIMNAAGHIMLVGDFIEDEGVYYSNSGYKLPSYYYGSKSKSLVGRGWYDWDDYAPYGYGYEVDTLDELIDMLPFRACETCYANEECALSCPDCKTEKEAEENAAIYEELWWEESDAEEEKQMTLFDEKKAA